MRVQVPLSVLRTVVKLIGRMMMSHIGNADPTVIISCAGGYVHYRINSSTLTVEISEEGCEEWQNLGGEFQSLEEIWNFVGQQVGLLSRTVV